MAKSAVISARIEAELKQSVDRIFMNLGLTTTQAITIFLKLVEINQGFPFMVKIPNETTIEALEEARAEHNLKSFNTTDQLFEYLEI